MECAGRVEAAPYTWGFEIGFYHGHAEHVQSVITAKSKWETPPIKHALRTFEHLFFLSYYHTM